MSKPMRFAIGGGGSFPSAMARRNAAPDMVRAAFPETTGSCHVTVRVRSLSFIPNPPGTSSPSGRMPALPTRCLLDCADAHYPQGIFRTRRRRNRRRRCGGQGRRAPSRRRHRRKRRRHSRGSAGVRHLALGGPRSFARHVRRGGEARAGRERARPSRAGPGNWRESMAALYERRTGPKKIALEDELAPATVWNPSIRGAGGPKKSGKVVRSLMPARPLPKSDDEIAYATVAQLSQWIKSRALTSTRLTQIYLDRMERFDPR